MACCGCSNKNNATAAGTLGLIQSIVALALNAFFLNLYVNRPQDVALENADERLFLLFATKNVNIVILILLAVASTLHVTWFVSSLVLLVANGQNECVCGLRQWVVVTSFVIIGDIILPAVLIGVTVDAFQDAVCSISTLVSPTEDPDNALDNVGKTVSLVNIDLYKYYILLVVSFCKGGVITITINIFLNVFTNRRASEMKGHPSGYVLMTSPVSLSGQTFPIAQQGHWTTDQQFGYSQGQGFVNPNYTGGQPGVTEPHFVQFANPHQGQVLDTDQLHNNHTV